MIFLILITINVITFLLFALDKRRARQNKERIPELTLFIWLLLGGSIGGWLGMRCCRHKTKHLKFSIGIPALFFLQSALIYLVW